MKLIKEYTSKQVNAKPFFPVYYQFKKHHYFRMYSSSFSPLCAIKLLFFAINVSILPLKSFHIFLMSRSNVATRTQCSHRTNDNDDTKERSEIKKNKRVIQRIQEKGP